MTEHPPDPAAARSPERQGDPFPTIDPSLEPGPETGLGGDPARELMEPTDLLSAAERRELIGSMTPEDAERVPELHEVDVPPELQEKIETAMSRYPQLRSASIPALWAVQRHYGWCTPDGIRQAAAVMGLTPAYLQSVASFYDLFRLQPTGTHRVLVCTNISCWMNGGDELLQAFCDATGCDHEHAAHGGADSADGDFMVSGFECLGACDLAPMASIDELYYGPLELDEVTTIVDQLRSGAEVLPAKDLRKRLAAGGPDVEDDPRVVSATGPAAAEGSGERQTPYEEHHGD